MATSSSAPTLVDKLHLRWAVQGFTKRHIKTLIRCLVVLLASMVLFLDQASLQVMGQAGFFAAIVAIMLPPMMAVATFFFAASTLLVGMLLGWAWGAAAMAASLAARDRQVSAAAYERVQSNLMTNPDATTQTFVFEGFFLDTQSSAVYGAFFFIGCFFFGAVRAEAPKLTLLAIFGTIVLDVLCSYGPLFPSPQYTLVTLFLIPTSSYVAIALAGIVLIFPQTIAHLWLTTLVDGFLKPSSALLGIQGSLLTTPFPTLDSPSSAQHEVHSLHDKATNIRKALVATVQEGLLGQLGMINLEVTRGVIGPGDLKGIGAKLKGLGSRTLSLNSFLMLVSHDMDLARAEEKKQSSSTTSDSATAVHKPSSPTNFRFPNSSSSQPKRYDQLVSTIREREAHHGHDLPRLIPILESSSAPLRRACADNLANVTGWFEHINSTRWKMGGKKKKAEEAAAEEEGLREAKRLIAVLEEALREFREADGGKHGGGEGGGRGRLITGPFGRFFEASGDGQPSKIKPEYLRQASLHPDTLSPHPSSAHRPSSPTSPSSSVHPDEKAQHHHHRQTTAPTNQPFAARSLFLCFVFTSTLESYAEELLIFLRFAVDLRQRRKGVRRVWWPSGFGKAWRQITHKGGESDPLGGSVGGEAARHDQERERKAAGKERKGKKGKKGKKDDDKEDESDSEEEDTEDPYNNALDPDAAPPRTASQKIGKALGSSLRWLKTPSGVFALRHAVVSLCIWVVAVHPSTAYFNYSNRGLWALIMAQTGLAVYTGDQIFNFIMRLGGTLVGLVVGMVVWYIGAGRGNGNPYGIAAATLVFCAPLLYARIVLPKQKSMFFLMMAVTVVFVVGYSYIDSHIFVTANSGVGVSLAWKRAVLVIIGLAAAFVIMCLPAPTFSRVVVRKTSANILFDISSLFGQEAEAFLAEEARSRFRVVAHSEDGPDDKGKSERERREKMKEKRSKKIAGSWLAIAGKMQAVLPNLATAPFEPQLKGPWPKERYHKLLANEWKLLVSISLLNGAFASLKPEWCSLLAHNTPFLNPNFLADVFLHLSILSQSLAHSRPLPSSLPSLRERLIYHHRLSEHHHHHASMPEPSQADHRKAGSSSSSGTEGDEGELDASAGKVDGISIGMGELTLETLLDQSFPVYATAVVALATIVRLFDEIADDVRGLVGTTSSFRGFDEWRDRDFAAEEEGLRRKREEREE